MNLIRNMSTQQHIDSVIHHLYMIVQESKDEEVLRRLQTCMSSINSLHELIKVKGVKG